VVRHGRHRCIGSSQQQLYTLFLKWRGRGSSSHWIAKKGPVANCETIAHPRRPSIPAPPRAVRAAVDRGDARRRWRAVGGAGTVVVAGGR
jgi:hypothetical protein